MLQWRINKAGEFNVGDEDLADTQLTLSRAAIHTTIMTATDILCELVIQPEVVDEQHSHFGQLRDRITARSRDTGPNIVPEKFDAHRFVDLRTHKVADPINYKNRKQYQFIAVTKDNMGFGYGTHTCPGRFFAANEIKLILARMLLKHDIRMSEGTQMLPVVVMESSSQANPRVQIEFKKAQED
ncbi:putative Ent-kaurene oxidase [Seiridium unicorne]|uniref:Ent-kaurene oxidase n=1 Tax=Seiridium unicorne TaxID=138068 RepID=A0ABR2V5Y1_9PEZI